jgi:predicted nucleic acid-binding protein
MICLDTNYLIMSLVTESNETAHVLRWNEAGERFCAPSIVWYEFMCGPVSSTQIAAIRVLLAEIVPFDDALAEKAARLFNAVGRPRRLRVDAMIAATAISRGVPLATGNREHFVPFADHGLQLLG